jgi:hypothetical protein
LLGFLAQLTRVCEESKNMKNKTMIEVKLDGSNNFKFLEDKTSKENLLRVIQKGLPETTIDEWKEDDNKTRKPIIYTSSYIEGPASK